ncbi:hypothetical protein [Belliella pelovolcani]|uniref:hypothetical protein n=1 Tax=Belliella pelovolcani TaxID=529505 RepID=UPI00391A16E2
MSNISRLTSKLKPNQFLLSGHLITELPILFQKEMVQANLHNRKSQTRRTKGLDLVNMTPYQFIYKGRVSTKEKIGGKNLFGYHDFQAPGREHKIGGYQPGHIFSKCPYGKPGDLLWVREKWAPLIDQEGDQYGIVHSTDTDMYHGKWKPSLHMPKIASRLWLMVQDITVQRVQDISEEDSIAEGCSLYGPFGEYRGSPHPNGGSMRYRAYSTASRAFQCIWEEINGKSSWKQNPWVWVVKYRILSKTGRPSDDIILKNYLEVTGKEVVNA